MTTEELEKPTETPETQALSVALAETESREEWGALPPKSNAGGFDSLDATVTHYTGASKGYAVSLEASHENCRQQVRDIQVAHLNIPEQSDIEYNALICSHGVVMEGRILGRKGGANGNATSNATMPSVCALVGIDDVPSQPMQDALAWFHQQIDLIAGRGLPRMGHYQIKATSCPGDYLTDWLLGIQPDDEAPLPDMLSVTVSLPELHEGDSGPHVVTLQHLLSARGVWSDSPANHDGLFGEGTEEYVIRYQDSRGLAVDGWVGVETWRALLEDV